MSKQTIVTSVTSLVVCLAGSFAAYNAVRSATRMRRIFGLIDAFNSKDPRSPPQELEYGQRMTTVLDTRYDANASDVVKIACRGQHVGRWVIPRDSFPMGRTSYLLWRKSLHKEHARIMRDLMAQCGSFSSDEVEQVCKLVGKQWDLVNDPLAMAVEDVAALVFLEYYFPSFYKQLDDVDKMVNIIRGTWKKMSERGRQVALTLQLAPIQAEIVQRALTEAPAAAAE